MQADFTALYIVVRTCDSVVDTGEMATTFHEHLAGHAYADGWRTPSHSGSQRQFDKSTGNSPNEAISLQKKGSAVSNKFPIVATFFDSKTCLGQ